MGAGYELKTNRTFSILVFVLAVVVTAAIWSWLLVEKL